ncbi:uncharacterized protein N7503_005582 [Penicillium pulvis]|uniref:uncharacterized protein n=1 Tax=Penicillium pulvis TaxID=1562058 RepID=UPI0025474853|nr:uncharacterized protein N7503_005582 [Penicillium pulvis]KAJ5803132.1 hypothetical protein N7503_005582 [Penicillium pulvis]
MCKSQIEESCVFYRVCGRIRTIGKLSRNVTPSFNFKDIKARPRASSKNSGNVLLLSKEKDYLEGILLLDFPGGEGESRHVGRFIEVDVQKSKDADATCSFGFDAWNADRGGLKPGNTASLKKANQIFGLRIRLLRKLAIVYFIHRLSISFK